MSNSRASSCSDLSATIGYERGQPAARSAAAIWARATARRDGLVTNSVIEEKLAGIESALRVDGSQLLVARADAKATAFAILVPRGDRTERRYTLLR